MEEPTLNTPFLIHYKQNPSPKPPHNCHFYPKFKDQIFENNQNPDEKTPQNQEYVTIKDQNFENFENPHEETPQNHEYVTIEDQNFENFENPHEKPPQNHVSATIKDQNFEKYENPYEKIPQNDQNFEKNENPDENFAENNISVTINDQNFETNENPYEFMGIFDGFCVPTSSTADPFRNHTVEISGVYEWFKIMICIPIVIIRGILFGLSLLIGYFATLIALQGWKDKHNPMPKWRCNLMWVTRLCARIILFSFGYQWIRRKGRPSPREVAPIVVSNHVSYIDPIFFFYELFPTSVASDSHDSMPFVGTIIRAMQVIYVNRFSPSSRKNAVNEIKRKAASKRFPRVLLFPEGTTTNGRFLLSFQMGAFIPGQPIQPVVVRYPYVHFDQSWGNISLARLMFRMFTQFHNFMEVEYLPVVRPLQIHKENASVFAERTAHAMASALNVLQTSYTYGDMMLMMKAVELKQENPSRYMVELGHVNSSYRIKTMESLEFLEKFVSMNPDRSGYVKIKDFLKVLRLKPCDLSEKIFAFVDIEKLGMINFKQFLLASNHIMKQPLFQRACEFSFSKCSIGMHIYEKEFGDAIRLAIPDVDDREVNELFKLFDMDGDGKIRKHEFLSCLRKNPLLIALFSSLLQDEFTHLSNGPLEEII